MALTCLVAHVNMMSLSLYSAQSLHLLRMWEIGFKVNRMATGKKDDLAFSGVSESNLSIPLGFNCQLPLSEIGLTTDSEGTGVTSLFHSRVPMRFHAPLRPRKMDKFLFLVPTIDEPNTTELSVVESPATGPTDASLEETTTDTDSPPLPSNPVLDETLMDSTQKSSEYLDMSDNNSNGDFFVVKSNLLSTDIEEEKSCEDFTKHENSNNDDFPAFTKDKKSYEAFDKCENNSNDEFPALLSMYSCIKPETEKSVTIMQEPPKFSYATMMAKKISTSLNAILPKKVVRVAPSHTESRPDQTLLLVLRKRSAPPQYGSSMNWSR
ncbi:hypothetical protein RND71_030216 [Anisodus tanguticus]|uniref:Uncharacterized protein n=1 Tax=Anisodus tanguticus TaxID=243964 RepID=A0AAE1UZG5_9SOLA|nr:hypothetical protein RND71_030216 [Anisodus tanguticus]